MYKELKVFWINISRHLTFNEMRSSIQSRLALLFGDRKLHVIAAKLLNNRSCVIYNVFDSFVRWEHIASLSELSLLESCNRNVFFDGAGIGGHANAWPFSVFTPKHVLALVLPNQSQPIWIKMCTHLSLYGIHLWADLDRDRRVGGPRPNQIERLWFL